MVDIIPSLPAQSFQELKTKVALVAGAVSTFQIDVADGMFTPARSWPMNPGDKELFQEMVRGKHPLPFSDSLIYEVHFMAHDPEKLLADWARLGIARAIFHIEARHNFSSLVSLAKQNDIELGVALKIGTPIERLFPYVDEVGVIQLMGIAHIGTQGQPFDERVLPMITAVRAQFPDAIIQIDGAVNADTAPQLVKAGVTKLAPGSFVFSSSDPHRAIHTLLNGVPH